MLSLSRVVVQQFVLQNSKIIPRQISTIGALYAAFTTRDLLAGSHGEAGTLITRFVKHIALEKCKTDPLIPQKIKYSSFYPLTDFRSFRESLHEIETDQIPRLLIYTYTFKTNGDPQKVAQALNEIDSICLARINEMDHETLLSTLYALMFLLPNKITKFAFYPRAIQKLVAELGDDCPKERLVEICFYLGLWKKHRRSIELMKFIRDRHLERYVDKFTQMEFAIVSNALFKSSSVCDSPAFKERLVQEVAESAGIDDSILITFVKSLRLNRVQSDKVLNKVLSLKAEGRLDDMQFKGLVHILALFADGHYNNPKICTFFTQSCLNKLDAMTNDDNLAFNDMRAKDLSTFVWACASLGYDQLTPQDYDFLTEIILNKVRRDEYKYCPDELIDTVLSLWTLGHKSQDLVQAVFELRSIPTESVDRVKLDSRLELLKSCIQIEEPNWIRKPQKKSFDEQRPAPKYLIEKQPQLQNVFNIIEENKEELGVKNSQYVAAIHQLNIASILVELEDGKKCFVEVLEGNHMLKFEEKPVSIVGLKLRLLEHLGYSIVVVPPALTGDQILAALKDSLGANVDLGKEKLVS
ncbi:unnamed protein product [Hermetia illucens]|uniref:RAP domain-containing protein n=1 Tax=Hermetia illucens TaxID=343691 RepID=A0A7R8YN52_HERIL|nr:uncharacterized protein LOC119651559 [Hermetia illucens]CAD7078916.1 unnamed protein product [Hermetia illucens]